MREHDAERGSALIEAVVAIAILGIVAIAGYGVVQATALAARGLAERGAIASLVQSRLLEARLAASYTKNAGARFTAGTVVATPEPVPTEIVLSPLVPTRFSLQLAVDASSPVAQLSLVSQPSSGPAISGAVDLVQSHPTRDATTSIALPSPIPQPTATAGT